MASDLFVNWREIVGPSRQECLAAGDLRDSL